MTRNTDAPQDFPRGYGTEISPTWRDLVQTDTKPNPSTLVMENAPDLGAAPIPASRYTSMEIHQREVDEIWKKTWQVVCREEEIPNVGDHFIYDIANLSFIIVRTQENEFKAFHNVCMHRGRQLVDKSGCGAKQFKCAYHSWTWNIDGSLAFYPGKWDFPTVEGDSHNLCDVKIDRWGGFLFINPDNNAGPLKDHLGSMADHFKTWPLDQRFTIWHVRKTINANWKVAIEAFLEGYHLVQTHPQALSSVAENGAQYDIWDEESAYFSRSITPTAVPSAHSRDGTPEGAIADIWALVNGLRQDEANTLPDEITDRASLSAWRRNALKEMTGADYSSLSDALMLDSVQYWLWPNFCPWFGEGLPLTYLFRPNSDGPDTCYMDAWMLVRKPDGAPAPAAAPLLELSPDDRFEPHLGAMGLIFDQDDFNMPKVQDGMKAWPSDRAGVTPSRYQEIRIRFLHQILENKLGLNDGA